MPTPLVRIVVHFCATFREETRPEVFADAARAWADSAGRSGLHVAKVTPTSGWRILGATGNQVVVATATVDDNPVLIVADFPYSESHFLHALPGADLPEPAPMPAEA